MSDTDSREEEVDNNENDQDEENEEDYEEDFDDDDVPEFDDDFLIDSDKEQDTKKEKSVYMKAEDFIIQGGSKSATERLLRDLTNLSKSDTTKLGFSAAPIDDNLYKWEVKLFGFDEDSELAKDLTIFKDKFGLDYVKMLMTFPSTYPFSPPFVRVILPRFKFRSGHVTTGGSICMQLLTTSGWTAVNDIESVLIQIRAGIVAGDARLELDSNKEYSEQEALTAFKRVAESHGWEGTPKKPLKEEETKTLTS